MCFYKIHASASVTFEEKCRSLNFGNLGSHVSSSHSRKMGERIFLHKSLILEETSIFTLQASTSTSLESLRSRGKLCTSAGSAMKRCSLQGGVETIPNLFKLQNKQTRIEKSWKQTNPRTRCTSVVWCLCFYQICVFCICPMKQIPNDKHRNQLSWAFNYFTVRFLCNCNWASWANKILEWPDYETSVHSTWYWLVGKHIPVLVLVCHWHLDICAESCDICLSFHNQKKRKT